MVKANQEGLCSSCVFILKKRCIRGKSSKPVNGSGVLTVQSADTVDDNSYPARVCVNKCVLKQTRFLLKRGFADIPSCCLL